MLHQLIDQFLEYCRLVSFSNRSIETLNSRLNEFKAFLKHKRKRTIKSIKYVHLAEFVSEFKSPSIHVTKSRIWMLRQFYHFLTLYNKVPENIAKRLPYPKIEKTVPQFLTVDEYQRLIEHFSSDTSTLLGLRNLIIIMLLGTLGLRTASLIAIDIEDIDIKCGLIWVVEKGRRSRSHSMPYELCRLIQKYLSMRRQTSGPFLLSKRKQRISPRTLQDLFRSAADELGIDKKLHARLFRHTAATHLNRVAGIDITQHIMGHSFRKNTERYAHLNPDQYAVYMRKHPFNQKEAT